ncbi:MAG: helix-turn-helix transcriptional regulator [Pseudobutyrivibrio sp.]|nr:helix-turn-helix transcriptional regulator [Pseudobutyrivibrio sp.]
MNEEVLNTFTQYLLVMRVAAKLTQEELGKMLGVSKETISHLEQGKTKLKLYHYIAMRSIFEEISCLNLDEHLIIDYVLDLVDSKMNKTYNYWFEAIMDI